VDSINISQPAFNGYCYLDNAITAATVPTIDVPSENISNYYS